MNLKVHILILFLTLSLYSVLYIRNGEKVKGALLKGFKNFIRSSIRIFSIFVVIGILQSFLSREAIFNLLTHFSGVKGVLVGALLGALMMGPAVSGYPICRYILEQGGSAGPVSSFLFSWVMIGFISIPLEMRLLGRRFTLVRNSFALFSAIVLGLVMEALL